MSEASSGPGSLTAEIRFWWPNSQTAILRAWLEEKGMPLDEEGERTDDYLFTGSEAVNLKRRDRDRLEIKCLVDRQPLTAPFAGQEKCEIWVKHELLRSRMAGGPPLSIEKHRWLVFLDEEGQPVATNGRPSSGCQVELSEVKPVGAKRVWTSFCLEAFGEAAVLAERLSAATRELGDLPCAGELPLVASYAKWLGEEDYFELA